MKLEEVLATPRTFTEGEIDSIRGWMDDQSKLNPLWPIGLEATKWHFLCATAEQVNNANEVNAKLYKMAVKDWDENRLHNPGMYPLEKRPKAPKKMVVALVPVEGTTPQGRAMDVWPTAVASGEAVCEEVPYVDPDAPKVRQPNVVAIGPANPRVPGEYVALPEDTMPHGYSFVGPDGSVWTKYIFMTPFGSAGVWRREEK